MREPVHVVYGGAHLFSAATPAKVGALARASLEKHAPSPEDFEAIFGLPSPLAAQVHARVRAKLGKEPVEDYRVDFEDGYGFRADAEEDAAAAHVAAELTRAQADGGLPPLVGVRVKSFQPETRARAERTLRILLGSGVPAGLLLTLPKVTDPAQVADFARILAEHDPSLRLEIMVEHVRAIYAADGTLALPKLVAAAGGKCVAAHFGTYDYTASAGITAAWQRPDHPACDLARGLMQIALADTGVRLSDGATTLLPVEPHKSPTAEQAAANTAAVRHAWRVHYDNVRRSLAHGFYQGWDLHPAQLVARYAANYAFFLETAAPLAARLRNFLDKAAQATRVGAQFDDAATGQGLLETFARGHACGAYTAEDVAAAGLGVADLDERSFARLVARRTAG